MLLQARLLRGWAGGQEDWVPPSQGHRLTSRPTFSHTSHAATRAELFSPWSFPPQGPVSPGPGFSAFSSSI